MNLLITGFAGVVGQAIAERLMHDNPFRRVFGIDREVPRLLGPVHFVQADLRTVDLADLLVCDMVDVVLHLEYADGVAARGARDEPAVTRRLLEATELAETRRLVVVSRDWVYAAGEGLRSEDDPLRAVEAQRSPPLAAKLRAERMWAQIWKDHPSRELVCVRLPSILGPDRGRPIDAVLDLPWLIGPAEPARSIQFVHVHDAADALLVAAAHPDLRGPFNVAGPEPIDFEVVAGILEKRLVRPPPWLLRPALAALLRAHGLPTRYADPGWFQETASMSCARFARATGFRPRYSTRQALAVWRTRHSQRIDWNARLGRTSP